MTGAVVLDKPEGITSFWAAAQLRRVFGERKIGHTGTLDPMASGVLPILLGGATRFASFLPSRDKAYRATFLLGAETDTLDITGTVVRQRFVDANEADVRRTLQRYRGRIRQVPPMYSAVKSDGVRLYELARQGVEVEREARDVKILRLDLVHADALKGEYTIDVQCSAGTYIRSLVSDVGRDLGCGAVLTALRRTAANGIPLSQAHTLDFLRGCGAEELPQFVIPVDRLLEPYPAVTVTDKQSVRFGHGGELSADRVHGLGADGLYRVYRPDGTFSGLGDLRDGVLAVRRLLTEKD